MKRALLLLLAVQSLALAKVSESVLPLMDQWSPTAKFFTNHQLCEMQRVESLRPRALRVVSYNMLYNRGDAKHDDENRWPRRSPRVVELIEHLQPDLIGSQELYIDQIEDLMGSLDATYAWVGAGRLDGQIEGEIEAIFYRKERLQLIWWQSVYMSETPDVVSPGPTGKYNPLTVACFCDKVTGRRFVVLNTHFDFGSPESRAYEAQFLNRYVETLPKELAVIVTGDFNTFPVRPELSLPFYDGDHVLALITQGRLKNTGDLAVLGKYGPLSTSTFDGPKTPFAGQGQPGVILDHIFVGGPACVLTYAVEPAKVNGHYPSDHMPVVADIALTPCTQVATRRTSPKH